jgi:hypothetical protein
VTLIEQLGLEHPVLQAGMGGAIATARVAGAVSGAGAPRTVGIMPPPIVQRLSAPLRRLPLAMTHGLISARRSAVPLFGPAAPLAGMPARLIEASPL